MKKTSQLLALALAFSSQLRAGENLAQQFQNPPEETKPWCYWYWYKSDITQDGITKDLEAMKKAGIRVAMIGNIEQGRQPSGSVKMFSPEWTAATLSSFKDGWVAVPGQEAPNSLAQEVVFNLPEALAKSEVVKLDLGKVNIMATVTLNGKAFETLWMPPFELDVTKALQPGENRLRVQVVSTVPPQPSFGLEIRLLPVSKTTFQ